MFYLKGNVLSENVKLYTIQTNEAWNQAKKVGAIRLNDWSKTWCCSKPVNPKYRRAYEWMIKQMAHYIGEPVVPDALPIWAWHTKDVFPSKACDLEQEGHLITCKKRKCIIFSVPKKHILLSNFSAWHYVLSNCYVAFSDEEDEAFETWCEMRRRIYKSNEVIHSIHRHQSWQRIFQLEKSAAYHRCDWTQACLWEVPLDSVEKVITFHPAGYFLECL